MSSSNLKKSVRNIHDSIYGTERNILESVDINFLPREFKSEFDTLASGLDYQIVGSFIYKNQKYPGDIDMRQDLTLGKSKKQAITSLINILKNIAKNYSKTDGRYYFQIKIGYNPYYEFIQPYKQMIYFSIDHIPDRDFAPLINFLEGKGLMKKTDLTKLKTLSSKFPISDLNRSKMLNIFKSYYF